MVNMFGITETTVHVTYRPLTMDDIDGNGKSYIGVSGTLKSGRLFT